MDGDLPPVAAQRVRRQAESRVAGSLLSAPAAAALASAGLEPAGEVMGCVVLHLGRTRQAGCGGYSGAYISATPVRIGGKYAPYRRALEDAYRNALARMTAEARALGADGVVGVRTEWTRLDRGARELLALGSAVRFSASPGAPIRPAWSADPGKWPFTTELSGAQVATALLAGWLPVRTLVAVSVAVKHEDTTTKWLTSRLRTRQNVELAGLTQLVTAARADARTRLGDQADRLVLGDGQVVVSANTLELRERPCGQERDHLAEAVLVGTALEFDPRRAPSRTPSPLTFLPLRDRPEPPAG